MWGRGGPVGTLLALAAVAAIAAGPARADSSLVFGFSDDTVKWDGTKLTDPARDVGATALRLSLPWAPGKVDLDAVTAARDTVAVLRNRSDFVQADKAESRG